MIVELQRIDYHVVHAIAGRIRIKIPRLQIDPDYAHELQRLVKSLDAVTNVYINYASASIVVEYKTIDIENKAIQEEIVNYIQQAGDMGTPATVPAKSSDEYVSETTNKHEAGTEAVINKLTGIQIPDEYLSSDRFPINIDLTRKVFEVGIPAAYVLEPLNAELDKLEAENEQNTQLQRIRLELEAFLKEGGFLVTGTANAQFRQSFVLNPISSKKYYTPWVSMTAVVLVELDARVVDETIIVKLTKLNVSSAEDRWYKTIVKYVFEFIFKTKIVAKINGALSQINGVKIQQLFFQVKGDKKLRQRAQELGLSPSRLDNLLELVEVNARVAPDYLWLYVQL